MSLWACISRGTGLESWVMWVPACGWMDTSGALGVPSGGGKHTALQTFLEAVRSLGIGPLAEQNQAFWNMSYCWGGWLLLKRNISLDGKVGIIKQNQNKNLVDQWFLESQHCAWPWPSKRSVSCTQRHMCYSQTDSGYECGTRKS